LVKPATVAKNGATVAKTGDCTEFGDNIIVVATRQCGLKNVGDCSAEGL